MTEPPVAAKMFRVMRGANFARMALLVLTSKDEELERELRSPAQPMNLLPAAGMAMAVRVVPSG